MPRHHGTRSPSSRAARQGVVDRLDGSAGNAEHVLDPRPLEAGDDELRYLDLDQLVERCRRNDPLVRAVASPADRAM